MVANSVLQVIDESGCRIVNSPLTVKHCGETRFHQMMHMHGLTTKPCCILAESFVEISWKISLCLCGVFLHGGRRCYILAFYLFWQE